MGLCEYIDISVCVHICDFCIPKDPATGHIFLQAHRRQTFNILSFSSFPWPSLLPLERNRAKEKINNEIAIVAKQTDLSSLRRGKIQKFVAGFRFDVLSILRYQLRIADTRFRILIVSARLCQCP